MNENQSPSGLQCPWAGITVTIVVASISSGRSVCPVEGDALIATRNSSRTSLCRCNKLEMEAASLDSDVVRLQNVLVIEERTKAECVVCMHSVQWPKSVCLGSRLRSQGMVSCSMHMLQLPTSFVRPCLPNRTFFAIKGVAPRPTLPPG